MSDFILRTPVLWVDGGGRGGQRALSAGEKEGAHSTKRVHMAINPLFAAGERCQVDKVSDMDKGKQGKYMYVKKKKSTRNKTRLLTSIRDASPFTGENKRKIYLHGSTAETGYPCWSSRRLHALWIQLLSSGSVAQADAHLFTSSIPKKIWNIQ